jgi:carboxypeptidase-like protein
MSLPGVIRFISSAAFFCLFAGSVFAQDNLTGRIYENNTRNIIPGISIRNLKTNNTTVSDNTGAFSIPAKVGDLVVFMGFAYATDTLYVQNLNYTDVKLTLKQNMLNGVKVTGQQTRLGNLKPEPTLSPFGGQTLVYQTDEKGNYTGGVSLNIFDSHAAAKKRQKEADLEKDDKTQAKIASVFNEQSLKNYIPLKGQEMQNFIILYTPDQDTYTSKDFNLTMYLNTCYQAFLKIPAEKRQSKDFLNLLNKGN